MAHGKYIEVKIIQLYAWNWHFKKFLTKSWVSSRVVFEGVLGAQNDVLLAKTMLQNTQITTINMDLLNKTMHYVHKQCMELYGVEKYSIMCMKLNYLEIPHRLANILDVLKGDFWGFGYANDALLAKTMLWSTSKGNLYWLRMTRPPEALGV